MNPDSLSRSGRRLPSLSLRFVPIFRRNLLVWRKLALASVLTNIAEPLITLVALGYGLGRLMPQVDGVDYVVFLAAGSACMSTAMAASFEALYSAFSRMHVQRTWEALMNAPLELDDVLLAEWLWAAAKSTFTGLTMLAVVFALGISREPTLLLAVPVVMLTGLAFSAIGLCFNALARGYDFFSYYFTLLLTPMVFLSGVYYPVAQLPDWLRPLAPFLPLGAAVELARPLVLGRIPESPLQHVVLLVVVAVGAFVAAVTLTRRRFDA